MKNEAHVIVEVCVQGVASAFAASEGGAQRVELCEDLAVGGVTPSAGMIAVVCRRLQIPTHVLIRPRGGDFCYTDDELSVMVHDVETAKALGADGVVLGLLRPDHTVDAEHTARFVDLAEPLTVTFHKAFDETPDPFEALETLMVLGVDRILSSGQAPRATEGLERLEQLLAQAGDRIVIMAGGSITQEQVPAFVTSGLREIHVGSAVQVGGKTHADLVRQFVQRSQPQER